MTKWILAAVLAAAALATAAAAQNAPMLLPPQVEKGLAARASDVTEVTLNKSMLGFAARFMKDKNDDAVRQLVEGLDSIYVREYQFDKEGQYAPEIVEQLRQSFQTPEWAPLVHEQDRKRGQTTDVLVKLVNGQNHGMFILTAEPRELTMVMILGPIRMEDLGKLKGIAGLGGAVGSVSGAQGKGKDESKNQLRDKGRDKSGNGGAQ